MKLYVTNMTTFLQKIELKWLTEILKSLTVENTC